MIECLYIYVWMSVSILKENENAIFLRRVGWSTTKRKKAPFVLKTRGLMVCPLFLRSFSSRPKTYFLSFLELTFSDIKLEHPTLPSFIFVFTWMWWWWSACLSGLHLQNKCCDKDININVWSRRCCYLYFTCHITV